MLPIYCNKLVSLFGSLIWIDQIFSNRQNFVQYEISISSPFIAQSLLFTTQNTDDFRKFFDQSEHIYFQELEYLNLFYFNYCTVYSIIIK